MFLILVTWIETKKVFSMNNEECDEGQTADGQTDNSKKKVNKILLISRILFPLSFAIFNLVYWFVYIS